MDLEHLKWVLSKFGGIREGTYHLAPCPVHQPEEQDPNRFKLRIAAGSQYPVLLFCFKCCERGKGSSRNASYLETACGAVGVPPGLLREKMDSGQIRLLWSQLGIEARKVTAATDINLLHSVYSYLLNSLTLIPFHKKWLEKRGLPSDKALELGYRSTPEDCGEVENKLKEEFGSQLKEVPGFMQNWSGLKLCLRSSSILHPCRNLEGKVLALKQRLLDGGPGRMRLVGNSKYGGPKALCLVHVPLGVGGKQWPEVVVTEGERKADVSWLLSGRPTVGIPGVGTTSLLAPVLPSLLAPGGTLVVALDQEWEQDSLRRAVGELVKMGVDGGYTVKVAKWSTGKGLDDALRTKTRIEEEAVENNLYSPPNSFCTYSGGLRDWEIIPFLTDRGPMLRSDIPLRHPAQDYLISKWIREGVLNIRGKTKLGQILEVTNDRK